MQVVFDIGNVLLRWDPRNLYRKLFDEPGVDLAREFAARGVGETPE